MMKASAASKETGKMVGIIGLSHGNIGKLMEGKPIVTSADFLGIEGEIMIFVAPTEQAMQEMMKPFIGPNTETHIDPKLKDG
jgi:hypothetical protein